MIYEAEVAGPPTTLNLFNNTGGYSGRDVIYGTSDGKIGLLEMGNEEPMPKWELANEKRLAGVTCLDNYDITNDGVLDLIVGREDGTVEVYGYDSMDNPTIKYTYVII
jgi:Bardet-Biedl syndrome 7 protein